MKFNFKNVLEAYTHVWKDVRSYWLEYGGTKRFAVSPYVHAACFTTLICANIWTQAGWSDLSIQILPSMLGFALAAYALLLAFGDQQFRETIASPTPSIQDPTKQTSTLLRVSATFLHFIVVQVVALGLAVLSKGHVLSLLNSLARNLGVKNTFEGGFWFIIHQLFEVLTFAALSLSIWTALAAAFAIFHTTQWYVEYVTKRSRKQ